MNTNRLLENVAINARLSNTGSTVIHFMHSVTEILQLKMVHCEHCSINFDVIFINNFVPLYSFIYIFTISGGQLNLHRPRKDWSGIRKRLCYIFCFMGYSD